jgi:hypothetical protein
VNGIRESDWKHLRQLKPVALDRFCSRTLSEVETALADSEKAAHERYLKVYELIQNRDKELGRMFDDLKRSNAVGKLFSMRRTGLVTDAEWNGFSEEIKSTFDRVQNS